MYSQGLSPWEYVRVVLTPNKTQESIFYKQGKVIALTEKQKRFCDEYLVDCNATQAAIRAGYSKKTAVDIGHENLNKPQLKEYIEARLEQMQSEKIASIKEVLEYLTAVMRGEAVSQELVTVGTGSGCSEGILMDKHPDESERLKAAELLCKRYGLFRNCIDVDIEKVIIVNDLKE